MRRAPALAAMAVLATAAAPAMSQTDAKLKACAASPSHACVLDLLWDQMPKVGRDYQAETKRAFIDAALLTGDKALIDLYLQRTDWGNRDALDSSYIAVARQKADRATLISYGDKAISGLRFDWYQLSAIANGLAEIGETDRARKVAELIPHGPDDSVTTLNLYQHAQEVIGFHDATPVTARTWADQMAGDNDWWEEADITWLNSAASRAGDFATFPKEIQDRYRADGWKYLRALARLAPQITASPEPASAMFRAHIETWADPRNDRIAEFLLAIAARSHPDVRTAILGAFDARQPSPPGKIARMRALIDAIDAPLNATDKALFGLAGGTYEQRQAAIALATLTQDEFLAQARTGEGSFLLARPAVLRASLRQTSDTGFALAIGQLMAELGEPRTIDGYDYAQYATEWAVDTCQADLFKLAESRLARRDGLDTMMWGARFDRDPVSVIEYVSIDDRISSDVSDALRGYQLIIQKGYCSAG